MSEAMELHKGRWRSSCPLPYYLRRGRCRCECGKKFPNEGVYRDHWRREHDPLHECGGDGCPGCSDCRSRPDDGPEERKA